MSEINVPVKLCGVGFYSAPSDRIVRSVGIGPGEELCEVLTGAKQADEVKQQAPEHADWIDFLTEKYGCGMDADAAQQAVRFEIGEKFTACLEDAGVFKQNEQGFAAFDRFMASLGCEKI